jgi:hypothetical protein
VSNIDDMIMRRGEDVDIYRRSQTGTDEYNRPVYSWSKQATEKAIVQPVGYTTGVGEVLLESGERVVGDHVGYFQSGSVIRRNDQVDWKGVRLDVKGIRVHREAGATRFYEAIMKRMIE